MPTLDEKTIAELRELVSTTPTGIGGKLAIALLDERAEMQAEIEKFQAAYVACHREHAEAAARIEKLEGAIRVHAQNRCLSGLPYNMNWDADPVSHCGGSCSTCKARKALEKGAKIA